MASSRLYLRRSSQDSQVRTYSQCTRFYFIQPCHCCIGRCLYGEHSEGCGHLHLDAERTNGILINSARRSIDVAHKGKLTPYFLGQIIPTGHWFPLSATSLQDRHVLNDHGLFYGYTNIVILIVVNQVSLFPTSHPCVLLMSI